MQEELKKKKTSLSALRDAICNGDMFSEENLFTEMVSEEMGGGGEQGFIQDFSKWGGGGGGGGIWHPRKTVPITNVLTARIHLWKNSRCF